MGATPDRPLADAPRVAAVTPAGTPDGPVAEKHGGGSSWAAEVEAEGRALAAMAAAIRDDEHEAFARSVGLELDVT